MAETTNLNPEEQHEFDPLDMNNYKVEKLPKMQKSGFEKWMARLGGPLAILVFVLLYWVVDIPFIDNLDPSTLDKKAKARYEALCPEVPAVVAATKEMKAAEGAVIENVQQVVESGSVEEFSMPTAEGMVVAQQSAAEVKEANPRDNSPFVRICYAMLAIFCASMILWVTEAVPSYMTSLLVILTIVLTGVTTQKEAFAQLGHPVMWLNILSFVLASMLVKTRVAKRLALWFVLKFGKNATGIFISFIIINVILSLFISATTVKATILLPIFMVVAAIYGASNGSRNNFGRNIVLQNLFQVNIGASAFMTGSGANLLAVSLILGAGGSMVWKDWFVVGFPLAMVLLILGWLVGTKLVFPMKKNEQKPQIEGGIETLQREYDSMGKMTFEEYKAIGIFILVLFLWVTGGDEGKGLHSIDATTVAFIGAVLALMPGVGVVKWNDVDIPWHLMLFSAGAYTLGSGLNATDLPSLAVNAGFNALGISQDTPFVVLYVILTGLMLFSGLVFQSKTMRALIFIPIAIGVAQRFGYPVMSLAFPMALLIEHVYVLPFNSKPAALLYTTNHYSWSDTFKFGIIMMFIAWVMIMLWGQTVLQWAGYTPGLF
ncbi:MAG: DASS family sodium-coupled anion symporter [Tidjanibacter sp.]|nr:DASS family sodium-coupled anion symporter [Tidjanibacter sp.]